MDHWTLYIWLLDCPSDTVWLPTHNGENVHPGMMTWLVDMVNNKGRWPEMFLRPFPKGPRRLPYVLFITLQPVTCIPVYYSTFLCDVVLVFWKQHKASDGIYHPWNGLWFLFYHKCYWNFHLVPLWGYLHLDVAFVVAAGAVVGLSGVVFVVAFNFEFI